jgi:acyl-CoA dehydrogenase
MLEDAFTRLLDSLSPRAAARAMEAGTPPIAIAQALQASGFLDLLVPEADGGAGASLPELFPLARACGRSALPFPFAETALARSIFGPLPDGASVVIAGPGAVPLGAIATHLLHQEGATLLLSEAEAGAPGPFRDGSASVIPGATIARATAPVDLPAAAAAIVAASIAGACEAIAAMTLDHAGTRQQFGKPLSGFQAIQHLLARLAEETAAARAAAAIAFAGPAFTAGRSAIAKVRTADAARDTAAIAHQVHAAIGITAEHDLGLFTRRLHGLRLAHGSADEWAAQLGAARLAQPHGTAVDFLRTLA